MAVRRWVPSVEVDEDEIVVDVEPLSDALVEALETAARW